jgi:Flp pilus assembly protein CpaB
VENIMSSKLFTTRQGTILLGVIAAVIAGILLIVYLNSYRNSVGQSGTLSVMVAQKLIQKGTPGDVVRTNPSYYTTSDIAKNNVEDGAIEDPATLSGQVALMDISPGQQLTAADFGAASNSVSTQLNPNQRAVTVTLGSPQSVGGQVAAGSHVDVWVASTSTGSNGVTAPQAKLLFQDVYVLNADTSGGNVTLRTTPTQAGQIIYASSNDQIWLVLRPTIGTTAKKPPVIGAAQVTGH